MVVYWPTCYGAKDKNYFGVVGSDLEDANQKSEELAKIVEDLLEQLG